MTGLHRLQEEDPALAVHRDDETHQTVLSGHGRDPPPGRPANGWHASSTSRSSSEELKIPYRETISEHRRGRGAPQEADRRPRPVRRRAHPHRAARAR